MSPRRERAEPTDQRRAAVVVGLMSGTSLDGISAAAVRFTRADNTISADLLSFLSVPYTSDQRERLGHALAGASPAEYCRLGFDLGEWLANAAIQVIAESGITPSEIAAIASHGQTVWHEAGHSTWQIGEAAVIAERTGRPVISDLRVGDVAAGGQGAPIVPMADALLFASPAHWRALQNIGGIGNVTVVPPGGELSGVRAFDTGPGVVVIDAVVRRLRTDMPYDRDGALARAGQPNSAIVERLLRHPYFAAEPPKTTGRELFTAEYVERFIADCRSSGTARVEDIVATAVLFTAASIADAYRRFIPEPITETLIAGGGARNPALMDALAGQLTPLPVRSFDIEYFDGEAKEAVAFALLGYLHLMGLHGNVPSATGARGPRVLGKYTPR